MARRRKDNLLDGLSDFLMDVPWWGGPLVALAAFLLFHLVVPLVLSVGGGDPKDPLSLAYQVFPGVSVMLAPWVAMLVLVVWGVTLLKKASSRRLFDRQSGLDSIRDLSWREFERLVGEAYCRQGYSVKHTGSDAGDGGVDLVLQRDGQTTLVQCKHWKAWKVGVKEVRELLGVVASERASAGILVTCGDFTGEATAFACKNPITLVAGPELEQMIRSVQSMPRPAEVGDATEPVPPTCPACGAPMVRRTAKQGQFAGQAFWGCSRYPECRGKRAV